MNSVTHQLSKELVLGEVLARNARKMPGRIAIIFEEKRFTYNQIIPNLGFGPPPLLLPRSLGRGRGKAVSIICLTEFRDFAR